MGRYVYCADNPVKYVDPDGEWWQLAYLIDAAWTAADATSLTESAISLWNDPSWDNAGWALVNSASLAIPFVSFGAVKYGALRPDPTTGTDGALGAANAINEAAYVWRVSEKALGAAETAETLERRQQDASGRPRQR